MAKTATVVVRLDEAQMAQVQESINSLLDIIASVRDLHRPTVSEQGDRCCSDCTTYGLPTDWPCATARIVYSESEITSATPEA